MWRYPMWQPHASHQIARDLRHPYNLQLQAHSLFHESLDALQKDHRALGSFERAVFQVSCNI